MKSASYLYNTVSFNSNVSLVSNINYIRFNSDASINLSNCSTVINFDDYITDDDENLTDNVESMNDNNDSVELWEKVNSMTVKKTQVNTFTSKYLCYWSLIYL